MREMLFRGLDVNYNVWKFGSLIEYSNGQSAIITTADKYGGKVFTNEVIPETVGQYTGLKDRDGGEIYEGDIVKGYSVYPTDSTFESFLMGEVYYTDRGTWDCYSYILGGFNEQVEVIGNIHDWSEE